MKTANLTKKELNTYIIDNSKKNLGAFYTPKHVVDYMLSLLSDFNSDSQLLEPCGGDGVFISRILQKGLLKPHQIVVWDINPDVKDKIEKLGVTIQIKDTLLETEFERGLFFREQSLFSHIVGNPPYLNKQSLYIKKNKHKLKKIYKEIGANDTYAMFLYLCGNLLKPEGQLSFITSDTYLTLGIHKKLRKWLLDNFAIKEITLCPKSLFNGLNASVHTSIITIINRKPNEHHFIKFNDCKNNKLGDYNGTVYKVRQSDLLKYPDYVFYYKNNKHLISKIINTGKLIDYLDGGLGMHTTNNAKFLGIINYGDGKSTTTNGKKVKTFVPLNELKDNNWRIYHKLGGNNKYYLRPRYCLRWDKDSISHYKIPSSLNLNEKRQGFIVSGVCSTLSARLAERGALWESNKAMCFFPKEPHKYPATFFIGLLNSKPYNEIIKIFNHTNSIQIRDIKKLPFFRFRPEDVKKISDITKIIIKNKMVAPKYNFVEKQKEIDSIVNKYLR